MRVDATRCGALCALAIVALAFSLATTADGSAAEVTSEQILSKAITYHDPNSVWGTGRTQLGIHTTFSESFAKKSGAMETKLMLTLAPAQEEFRYIKATATDRIEITLLHGQSSVSVNGDTAVSQEDRERLRLREATMYRDYCEYLYGMPMKLRDPGTIIDPQVRRVAFDDQPTWQLRVTYEPEVGEHTWYFYFDPESFALVGYKFYFDESKNDGEYIVFEGEAVDPTSHLRLPQARAWYYNANDEHLATDEIVSISAR